MLQLRDLNERALSALQARGSFPPPWDGMAALERVTDTWIQRLRRERQSLANRATGPQRALEAFDRRLRTDRVEIMDRDDVPDATKVELVAQLHTLNRVLLSYHQFLRALQPSLERASGRTRAPARVLELASGSGEFTMGLAELARRRGLAVRITGSDVVPTHVERARSEAARRRLPVEFEVVDAFDMSRFDEGAFDVVFIAQAMHHFTPGQLAKMIAQARRVAGEAFIGIDGRRSFLVLGAMGAVATVATAATRSTGFAHDGLVSARKLYSEPELALIARIAAPDADVRVHTALPGHSVVTVRG